MPLYYTAQRTETPWDEWYRTMDPIRPAPRRQRTEPIHRDAEELQPISVLFVDSHNEVRSVLAHLQAEIARIWTLNQRGYNLFSCLDSAGLRLNTSLTRKGTWKLHGSGRSGNRTALDALIGRPQENEGRDLEHRFMEEHSARGLRYEDFDRFDYILAFDNDTLSDLRVLEWAAYRRAVALGKGGLRARTKLLGGYTRSDTPIKIPSPAPNNNIIPRRSDFDSTIRLIETALYNFLHSVTGWSPPAHISPMALAHRYRSRQFLARNDRVTDAKIRTLKYLHNRVSVDDEVEGRDTRVVTITAREAQLGEALSDCRYVFG